MTAPSGHIELKRTVASIRVGRRHRTELGDIDELAASIERDGLLQPITITPDGVLVCGARRLAAIKKLGWRVVSVWVSSGISNRLGHLLAEQSDNVLHKPLTPTEAAALYRELRVLMAEDAARRKAATQFSELNQPGADGPANFAGPSHGSSGTAREQAAAMIPGGASHATLDKIGFLEQLAADPAYPNEFRAHLAAELERIDAGAPVDPIYRRIRALAETTTESPDGDLRRLAADALARAKTAPAGTPAPRSPRPASEGEPSRYPVRAFVLTWGELAGWWRHYDAEDLAAELSDEQVDSFLDTAEGTHRFAEELRSARGLTDTEAADDRPERAHLRAL